MKRDATDTKDDIQSLARAHSADAIAVLAEIMNNTDAPAGARLSAAKALLDRGWGKAGAKPPDDGNRATPVSQIKRVIVDPRQHNAKRPSQPANAASLQAHSTKWIGIPVEQTRSGGQRGIAKTCFGMFSSSLRSDRSAADRRLTPKFRCRGICRTRVRPPPSGPPIKRAPKWGPFYWRTERDSNPRTAFTVTHFPGVRLQPLGHLSEIRRGRNLADFRETVNATPAFPTPRSAARWP